MVSRIPISISNTSSLPEVAGDAALLVDPHDPMDIANKMHQIYKDEALRERLIANARIQITKFNWNQSAINLWNCMMKSIGYLGDTNKVSDTHLV